MANSLDDIRPEVLNKWLPHPAPQGVAEWGFVLKTAQVSFVKVDAFNFQPGEHYLRVPVMLGVRTEPSAAQAAVLPEHAGVFTIDDGEGKTLCYAQFTREVGDVWQATLNIGAKQVGSAKGSVGTNTSPSFIEAAPVALTKHVAAKNN
ncbi:hypothetical protein HK414_22510 [Ramlibacter terrae]|uniref:Lipoprotein n=1 Tax=Ramlibacter terrae TaxID=2732511 RepID=A0ABX6P520_9BURK|nr:hypothetical protein HK414_22510 [Ramlibacter terrae]